MSLFEIWVEGYCASGDSAPARLLGRVEANTFEEACNILCSPEEWQQRNGNFNPAKGTVWGCKLFDNETDARALFG